MKFENTFAKDEEGNDLRLIMESIGHENFPEQLHNYLEEMNEGEKLNKAKNYI